MPIEDILILALATWRISSVLAIEDGPRNIFARIRYAIGVQFDDHSNKSYSNIFAEMVDCIWCNSFWIGVTFTFSYLINEQFTIYFALPFALSTVTIIINRKEAR